MSETELLFQQLLTGLSNGLIIALIALGYTMVYGIVELINFAHGDLFMLGAFLALTMIGVFGFDPGMPLGQLLWVTPLLMIISGIFCGGLNVSIDRLAYRPLRNAPRLAPLVSAIGVSFILLNVGLFWGGLPMEVFNMGRAAASPKDFPALIDSTNLLGSESALLYSTKDLMVLCITVPLMILLSLWVKYSRTGRAMRAVAQDPFASQLMGIDVDSIISKTFFVGGFLGGVASVMYALFNNTVFFQMGFRVGIDAFSAAVLGGIGSLPGAVLGGILIGLIRSCSDQYIQAQWTNTIVFAVLILFLIFRPQGLLGQPVREKV